MDIFHQKERGDILVDNEKSDINLTNETPRSYQLWTNQISALEQARPPGHSRGGGPMRLFKW